MTYFAVINSQKRDNQHKKRAKYALIKHLIYTKRKKNTLLGPS